MMQNFALFSLDWIWFLKSENFRKYFQFMIIQIFTILIKYLHLNLDI